MGLREVHAHTWGDMQEMDIRREDTERQSAQLVQRRLLPQHLTCILSVLTP